MGAIIEGDLSKDLAIATAEHADSMYRPVITNSAHALQEAFEKPRCLHDGATWHIGKWRPASLVMLAGASLLC